MCDENLPKLVGMFEMFYARLMGIAHCIVPQILPIVTDPQSSHIQTPTMELLESIMKQNQQMPLGGNQMPSIVQIIVPAHSIQQVIEKFNHTEDDVVTSTTSISTTTTTTAPSELLIDDSFNDTITVQTPSETSTEPLRSFIPVTPISSSSPYPESEKEDEIDDIQLNEDNDSSDDYNDDDKFKKQRDRSDFRYVESFESEKTIAQKFEPDPNDNETELKKVMDENQIPSVLPVPKALSSSKGNESQDYEPPEVLPDQNMSEPDI